MIVLTIIMTIDDDSNNNNNANENVARSLILMLSSIHTSFFLLFWIHFPHGVIIVIRML